MTTTTTHYSCRDCGEQVEPTGFCAAHPGEIVDSISVPTAATEIDVAAALAAEAAGGADIGEEEIVAALPGLTRRERLDALDGPLTGALRGYRLCCVCHEGGVQTLTQLTATVPATFMSICQRGYQSPCGECGRQTVEVPMCGWCQEANSDSEHCPECHGAVRS